MFNLLSTPRNLFHLFATLRVFLRYGALFPLESRGEGWRRWLRRRTDPDYAALRPGLRLVAALQALGPTYIKFGQALSTRPDLVGEEVAADLSELHDRLPPFPAEQAKAIIEDELDRPLAEIYSSFDDQPVAAASIARAFRRDPRRRACGRQGAASRGRGRIRPRHRLVRLDGPGRRD